MTVESTTNKVTRNGNDVATSFSFSFTIYESTDLVVTKVDSSGVETTLAEGASSTTYSVTVASYPGSGSITYPASGGTPLATGESLVIKRVLPLLQETDLENQGGYNPDTQEVQYDKFVMIDQQQQDDLNRSMKAPVSDDAIADMPTAGNRANKLLGFDASGDPKVYDVTADVFPAAVAGTDDGKFLVPDGAGGYEWTRTLAQSSNSTITYSFGNTNTGASSGIAHTITAGTRSFTTFIDYTNAYVRARGTSLDHWYRDFDYHYWRSSAGTAFAQLSSTGLSLGFGTQAAYRLDIKDSTPIIRLSDDVDTATSNKSALHVTNGYTGSGKKLVSLGSLNSSTINGLYYGGWGSTYQSATRHFFYAASAIDTTWDAAHVVLTLNNNGLTLGNSTNFAHIGGSGATADVVIGANGPNNGTGSYIKLHGSGHATHPNVTRIGINGTAKFELSGSGVVLGAATGGAQGDGTLNAEGLYVDGVAVGSGAVATHIGARVNFSGGTPSLVGSYWGVSSLTDNGVGITTLNYGVTFASSSDNICQATLVGSAGFIHISSTGTADAQVTSSNTTPAAADIDFNFSATGILA
ncbi:MAG: hypothetical protein VW338_05040 [Rhodospirillaceae bacterium]